MYDAVINFGTMHVGVRASRECLLEISYLPRDVPVLAPQTRLAERAVRQLERYRTDPNFAFDLPLEDAGTPFQQKVWRAMCAIPRGKTLTYGAMARSLGSAARAVGQACGANRFPIVIPCHRVVAANGLGGFAHHAEGFHVEVKRWLLKHEQAI